jgi:gliding motility-associated-like protein
MGGKEQGRNIFEQKLKDSLEQYEVPYNSADWAQMERALSSGVRGWGHGRSIAAGVLVAGALLIGGTAYFLGRDDVPSIARIEPLKAPDPADQTTQPIIKLGTTGQQADADRPVVMPPGDKTRPTSTSHRNAPKTTAQNGLMPLVQRAAENIGPSKDLGTMATFHASAKEACPGSPVEFTVEHMPADGIYLWNFGDGSFSNKPNPQHTFNKPGSYEVMLSLSSSGVGTIHNKPSSSVVVVSEAPTAAFDLVDQGSPGTIPSVHLENHSSNADTYAWDFGDGKTSGLFEPDHVFTKKGDYQVELTATSSAGCVDRSMRTLHIDHDYDLDAPRSFTPDGDGESDSFMPNALRQLRSKFQLAIYDTAGTLLYSTTDASLPWTGRLHNQGTACAAGDYVWVVDVDAASGSQPMETFTGKVRLER